MHPSLSDVANRRSAGLRRRARPSLLWPLVWVLLSGCAQAPLTPLADPALRADIGLGAPARQPDAEEALRLAPAMQDYVERSLRPAARRQGAVSALTDALTRQGGIHVVYDASTTRTAAETFEARSGNCLSLVLLSAALAQELGLAVEYREVLTDTQWSRLADMHVGNTHVNLALGPRVPLASALHASNRQTVIDFLPSELVRDLPSRRLDRHRVLAMFLNNRAAEWLVQGDLATAHAWSLAALDEDPAYAASYNTLGVVFQRHGRADLAERAWRQGLALAPEHAALLANLAATLRAQGRTTEAQAFDAALGRVEGTAPFMYLARGQAALRAGDPAAARGWLLKELARDPDYHEIHFALAQAELQLGHGAQALLHLQRASAESTRPELRSLYTAKAERLRAAGVH
jgi:Tfp pilus assembly protein PilF